MTWTLIGADRAAGECAVCLPDRYREWQTR
jgi:hypothetical protein